MRVLFVLLAAALSLLAGGARADAAYLKANPDIREVSVRDGAAWVLRWSWYWFRTRLLPGAKKRRTTLADRHADGSERVFNEQTIDAIGVFFTSGAVVSAFAVALVTVLGMN